MTTIHECDVPAVMYWENQESKDMPMVNIDILLKVGDLFVRRADGEFVPVECMLFNTPAGDCLMASAAGVIDENGKGVKVLPVVYD